MGDFKNDFHRKVKIRKETLVNMDCNGSYISNENDDLYSNSSGIEDIYLEIERNLEGAEFNYYQDGYWNINGSKYSIFIKKILRKIIKIVFGWYVFPIYQKQTCFNGKALNVMSLTRKLLIEQNHYASLIEQKIENIKKFQEEEHRVQLELISSIKKDNEDKIIDIESFYKKQYDEIIAKIEDQGAIISKSLDSRILNVNNAELNSRILETYNRDLNESTEELNKISQLYHEVLSEKLNDEQEAKKNIIVLTKRFRNEQGIEAIKNEAHGIYKTLSKISEYNVQLVSIEESHVDKYNTTEDIVYLNESKLSLYFENIKPELVIYCESTLYDVLGFNGLLLKYRTMLKLSSQNPVYLLKEKTLEELRHADDYGIINIMVESKYAHDVITDNGFKNVSLSYPVLDLGRIKTCRTDKQDGEFVVGFASSPMKNDQFENRGVELLEELFELLPDIKFKILWRNVDLQIPSNFLRASNCEVIYGKYDMSKFYSEVDCVVIPYNSTDNNHACSLSGIEAMFNNIPVVATDISGISEVVNYTGMGIVSSNKAKGLAKAITELKQTYNSYIGSEKQRLLNELLSIDKFVDYVDKFISGYFPKEFVTLEEWDYRLQENDKYLVKGHENIKKYYQNMEVAKNYNFNRFIKFPGNYFDEFERVSIRAILEKYYSSKSLNILDIASGDGRIVQENIKYGKCLSTDTSKAMLDIVESRFIDSENIETQICDYFIDKIKHEFDVITTFRYIRHFDYPQRQHLYKKIKDNLKDNGLLIFDAPNIKYAMQDKSDGNWRNYNIYDVFWTAESITSELRQNGFEVKHLVPIALSALESEPVSWTVVAKKAL